MSFFKRLFDRDLKKARAAEARGDLQKAIEYYAEADELDDVARLHRLRAQQARDPWDRVEILRLAASFTSPDRDEDAHRDVSLALATALMDWVTDVDVLDRRDKSLVEEAAQRFRDAGELEAAGDAYAHIGYHNKAAKAWTEAGAVEKLEEAYLMEEIASSGKQERRRLVDDFHMAEDAGLFLEASRYIDDALTLEPENPAIRDLHQRFHARMPRPGFLRLETGDGEHAVILLAGEELTLGRDEHATLTLLAPGLSRLHCRIFRQNEVFQLEDLGSRNGSSVDGAPASPLASLQQEGTIELGHRCILRYHIADQTLILRPDSVLGDDTIYVWGRAWRSRDTSFPAAVQVSIIDDYWHLMPTAEATVDAQPVAAPVLLRLDARIRFADGTTLIARPW